MLPAGIAFGGVELLIMNWELGLGLLEPMIEPGTHLFGKLGVLGKQIVLFPNILAQIIELIMPSFQVVNQFPISFHDDGAGLPPLVAIVWIVPKQWACW